MKEFGLLIMVLLAIGSAQAAVLSGSIYDLSLSLVPRAVVSINTTPAQRDVVTDGRYAFVVEPGNYTLAAEDVRGVRVEGRAVEVVEVRGSGNYTIDLILEPVLDEDLGTVDLPALPIEEIVKNKSQLMWLAWLLGIAAVVEVAYLISKRRGLEDEKSAEHGDIPPRGEATPMPLEHDPAADITKALAFIKEAGGRATQKDLRKTFPCSEAKVSLILTEMEHKGLVTKIKKGRGNVIVLRAKA
ncbi:hypothetical protein HY641_01660 [Candidatus Woesearchaeota archaeon]|nr:hypothetical protein [Candidatus Woesearchaeota archaeon]